MKTIIVLTILLISCLVSLYAAEQAVFGSKKQLLDWLSKKGKKEIVKTSLTEKERNMFNKPTTTDQFQNKITKFVKLLLKKNRIDRITFFNDMLSTIEKEEFLERSCFISFSISRLAKEKEFSAIFDIEENLVNNDEKINIWEVLHRWTSNLLNRDSKNPSILPAFTILRNWSKKNPDIPCLMLYRKKGIYKLIRMLRNKNSAIDKRLSCLEIISRSNYNGKIDILKNLINDTSLLPNPVYIPSKREFIYTLGQVVDLKLKKMCTNDVFYRLEDFFKIIKKVQ